jgi:hypothetical protein
VKLTAPQKAAIRLAQMSGGEIIIGGLDRQNVRPNVAFRLYELGLLSHEAAALGSGGEKWILTDAGRAALAENKPKRTHTAPPFHTLKGMQFYAKDSDGQWHYVNHADTWQACPPPVS